MSLPPTQSTYLKCHPETSIRIQAPELIQDVNNTLLASFCPCCGCHCQDPKLKTKLLPTHLVWCVFFGVFSRCILGFQCLHSARRNNTKDTLQDCATRTVSLEGLLTPPSDCRPMKFACLCHKSFLVGENLLSLVCPVGVHNLGTQRKDSQEDLLLCVLANSQRGQFTLLLHHTWAFTEQTRLAAQCNQTNNTSISKTHINQH